MHQLVSLHCKTNSKINSKINSNPNAKTNSNPNARGYQNDNGHISTSWIWHTHYLLSPNPLTLTLYLKHCHSFRIVFKSSLATQFYMVNSREEA